MKTVVAAFACILTVTAAASLAKDRPATGGHPPKPARLVDSGSGHDPNFSDPGNYTARSVAELKGISVAEAKRLLHAQQRSGLLIESLSVQFPDTFLGVRFDRGPGKIRTLFTGNDTPQDVVSEAAKAAGMSESVEVAPAAMSRKDEHELGDRLQAALRQAGRGDFDFTIDPENGVITLGTTEDAALQTLVEETGGSLVREVLFDPGVEVVLTTYSIAGQAWNAPDGTSPTCTTGFSVYHSDLAFYGATTAGHCNVDSPSEFNPYMNSVYGDPSGNRLVFRQQWIGNGLDIQFHTLGESGDETAPFYWNGTQSIPVRQSYKTAIQPTTELCKWGRETGWTCGTVANATVCDDIYGCGYYELLNARTEFGDSGGPVVSGQTAYGWIHGKRTATGAGIFLSVQKVYTTPLRLTVCVPGTNC